MVTKIMFYGWKQHVILFSQLVEILINHNNINNYHKHAPTNIYWGVISWLSQHFPNCRFVLTIYFAIKVLSDCSDLYTYYKQSE